MIENHFLHWEVQVFFISGIVNPIINNVKFSFWASIYHNQKSNNFSAWFHTSSFGGGNSIFLSILPGRNKAESNISILLVAIITCETEAQFIERLN